MGNDVDRSITFSAEVKNEWSYTSTPPTYLHGADRDNLASFLYQIKHEFILK
jgi:hypothetical protein